MVIMFDMNLGYILQSIEYIIYSYSLVLFIIFGYSCIVLFEQYNILCYVVLKTIWYSCDVVLCDFSAMIYGI